MIALLRLPVEYLWCFKGHLPPPCPPETPPGHPTLIDTETNSLFVNRSSFQPSTELLIRRSRCIRSRSATVGSVASRPTSSAPVSLPTYCTRTIVLYRSKSRKHRAVYFDNQNETGTLQRPFLPIEIRPVRKHSNLLVPVTALRNSFYRSCSRNHDQGRGSPKSSHRFRWLYQYDGRMLV